MKSLDGETTPRLLGVDQAVVGTACCMISALSYTGASICLRQLAGLGADETWVICIKEAVSVVLIAPWLLLRGFQGVRVVPTRNVLFALIVSGLAVQIGGNLSVQWAFGVVGMAITVPAVFGVSLTTSAVLGWICLREEVHARSIAAIVLLIVSIVFLSVSAGQPSEPIAGLGTSVGPVWRLLAIGAACLGGAMYAILSTVIRRTATTHVPVTSVVFIITSMGVLSLGGLSLWRLGLGTLIHSSTQQLIWMLGAGIFNFIAFLSITKGLQLTNLLRANLLNSSQVAMAAIAGVVLFGESASGWLCLGISLTIVGMLLLQKRTA